MHHYMPEIFYHDRKALLSVDIHPVSKDEHYKIVTSSVQNEVRIWDLLYEPLKDGVHPIVINFIASLEGHNAAINQVKFCQNPEYNLLASGDVHGRISIWQLSDQPCTAIPMDDFPPNKENWVRAKVFNHESDVTALCWSPCGKYLASVSNDDSLQVHEAVTGKRQFIVSYLRHFPNGVSYDPLGKYIITMSTDRKMDLLCAQKGTRLRSFGACELPLISLGNTAVEAKLYKLFHDDQLTTFTRSCAFSPCGQLIVAPVGRLEVGSIDVHCTYIFRRWELDKLPYRLVWLALTRESIIFYDSQHPHAIALVENISYNNISDAAWSVDGKNVVVSSMEGYVHYLKFNLDFFGEEAEKTFECPESPHFVKKKPKKEKRQKEEETHVPSTPTTPTTATKGVTNTPKSANSGGLMLKYLKKPADGGSVSSKTQTNEPVDGEPKAKKRIQLVPLD